MMVNLGVKTQKSEKKEETHMNQPFKQIKTANQLRAFADAGGKIGVTIDGKLYVFENGQAKIVTSEQAQVILNYTEEQVLEVVKSRGTCKPPSEEVHIVDANDSQVAEPQEVIQPDGKPEVHQAPDDEHDEPNPDEVEDEAPDEIDEILKHLENLESKFKMLNEKIVEQDEAIIAQDKVIQTLREEIEDLKL